MKKRDGEKTKENKKEITVQYDAHTTHHTNRRVRMSTSGGVEETSADSSLRHIFAKSFSSLARAKSKIFTLNWTELSTLSIFRGERTGGEWGEFGVPGGLGSELGLGFHKLFFFGLCGLWRCMLTSPLMWCVWCSCAACI
jgi:hypothetical protein